MIYRFNMRYTAYLVAFSLFVVAGGGVIGPPAIAQEISSVVPEDLVTLEKVALVFRAAFHQVEVDKDGDLRLTDSGIKTFISVQPKQKLLRIYSFWSMKKAIPDGKKTELMNDWNDNLNFVRFSLTKRKNMAAEVYVSYDGGFVPQQLVASYRTYLQVVRAAVQSRDPENMIGAD